MKVNKLLAKAFVLSDLLKYQADAIVSQEIVKKDTGTVTLFAFDKGQGLSEHTAPFDALVYLVDGRAEIKISGKPSIVKKGEMIIIPANKPHALKAMQKFKMLLVMIKNQ
ncbi:cupin [Candidatus Velamenicoccus archaeovorus]|jgi:quercetin dioxygenase-like cupin family protein|uniref:Cupin n=1 Tax=Velamenicoccus archaeovorus TaxID=1930593 RepID=A0A410P6U2_VELA1|nr:cupin domain-containing protein [Candidatus Velamenicoccus archaeovorus]MDD5500539.1 cupin domain-containing protein [Candidatus Omnitrophota bacterium]QAT17873.1 cupin [Candidatus Velamenicoccus archaeovorus]